LFLLHEGVEFTLRNATDAQSSEPLFEFVPVKIKLRTNEELPEFLTTTIFFPQSDLNKLIYKILSLLI
jgi:hypothetical protein